MGQGFKSFRANTWQRFVKRQSQAPSASPLRPSEGVAETSSTFRPPLSLFGCPGVWPVGSTGSPGFGASRAAFICKNVLGSIGRGPPGRRARLAARGFDGKGEAGRTRSWRAAPCRQALRAARFDDLATSLNSVCGGAPEICGGRSFLEKKCEQPRHRC